MPIRRIPGTDTDYYLVVFDEDGEEIKESDGRLLSDALVLAGASATDVFLASHGWKGDVPAAIEQYDAWFGAALKLGADREAARRVRPGFKPLLVGLHWPSLPWGDEEVPQAATGKVLSASSANAPLDHLVDTYATRIADTAVARTALRTILTAARNASSADLPPAVLKAYETLFAESGISADGAGGSPGSDQDGFDPRLIVKEAAEDTPPLSAGAGPQVLGFGDNFRDLILSPLRQLSFWKMKDRARKFGESGANQLLRRLQQANPTTQLHLMGHSFGCIVMSAAVAGPPAKPVLPRAVDSLYLVQGALSLWSYAADIPYATGTAGYFHRIVKSKLVRGPIVTTQSQFDTAVKRFYPMGAKVKKQLVLKAEPKFPKYGGVGTFGLQGIVVMDDVMKAADFAYQFKPGVIYNLKSDQFIRNGSGASGAHSDIAHPELAHVFLSAALQLGSAENLSLDHPLEDDRRQDASRQDRLRQEARQEELRLRRLREESQQADFRQAHQWEGSRQEELRHDSRGEEARQEELRQDRLREERRQEAIRQAQILEQQRQSARPPDTPRGGLLSRRTAARPGSFGPTPIPPSPDRTDAATPAGADEMPMPQAAAPEPAPPAQRWFNAAIEDRQPDEPMKKGELYTLAIDVDVVKRDSSSAAAPVDDRGMFTGDTQDVQLTIQLTSDDFEIGDTTRKLVLPRVGRSRGKARFDITPLHNGPSMVRAIILKDGNFVQQMELTFQIGGHVAKPVQCVIKGRPASMAADLEPRDALLIIEPSKDGYDCSLVCVGGSKAKLTISEGYLTTAIDQLRRTLMEVISRQANGEYVFQTSIDIVDPEDEKFALRKLARAGARLFQQIFFAPDARADSKTLGNFLKKLATQENTLLSIQVFAHKVPVPWGMLYLGDVDDDSKLDWNFFLGMRHIVECIPLMLMTEPLSEEIPSQPQLAVAGNFNDQIDVQMDADYVGRQAKFWKKTAITKGRLKFEGHTTKVQVLDSLKKANGDQILYFYCHASSAKLNAPGGPDDAAISFGDGDITLGDLNQYASPEVPFQGNPLVFINACESADLSPMFYDGFAPYFISKGARGVIGTECQTPALFAAEWAERFFERFLTGERLGEVFLALRREFLQKHRNPLGLLYAVHCSGDTHVGPGL